MDVARERDHVVHFRVLDGREQPVACRRRAVPHVHVGKELVGVWVRVIAHHGDLLREHGPPAACGREGVVESALLCFTHHRTAWLERFGTVGFAAAATGRG